MVGNIRGTNFRETGPNLGFRNLRGLIFAVSESGICARVELWRSQSRLFVLVRGEKYADASRLSVK